MEINVTAENGNDLVFANVWVDGLDPSEVLSWIADGRLMDLSDLPDELYDQLVSIAESKFIALDMGV